MVTSSSSPASRPPVVRSLARAIERPCARPGCPAPARATLTFSYATREATLERLAEEDQPQGYDLCGPHAARTEPPRGWELADRRPPEDVAPPPVREEREYGGEATVAVLAAALRAVPSPQAPVDEVPVADGPPPIPADAGETGLAAAASPPAPEVVPPPPADQAPVEAATPVASHRGPPAAPPVPPPPPAPARRPRPVPAARDRRR